LVILLLVRYNLYGKGAICFKSNEHEGIKRLQGSYMPPEEIMNMLDNMNYNYEDTKNQYEDVIFEPVKFQEPGNTDTKTESSSDSCDYNKKLLEKTVVLALIKGKISDDEIKEHGELSNNKIKLFCGVAYNTANMLLADLAKYGIVREQKKKKQGRPVESDKAVKFLHEHGYTIDSIEAVLNELAENWNEKNKPLITSDNIKNTLNQLFPYFADVETNFKQISNPKSSVNIGDTLNQQLEISINDQAESGVVKDTEDTKSKSDINNFTQHPNATVKKINLKDKTKANKVLSKILKKNENSPKNHRSNKKKEPAN